MKKITTFIITLLIAFTINTTTVSAALGTLSPAPGTNIKLDAFVTTLVNFAIGSGVAAFLVYFLWGAIMWITSAGDKGALDQARGRMTSAAIGLIMLASVWAIFSIVQAITYAPTTT
jgi:hypothetical protein